MIEHWEYPTTQRLSTIMKWSILLSGSFTYHQLGFGRLINSIEGWPGGLAGNDTDDTFDGAAIVDMNRHGFVALDDEPHEPFTRRQNGMLRRIDRFEQMKVSGPSIEQFEGLVAERAWRRFQRSMDYFAKFDVPILKFLPPMVARRAQDEAIADYAFAQGMPVLNDNRIDRYTDLFENENWFDFYHTSKAGAAAISTLLGRYICSFMSPEGTWGCCLLKRPSFFSLSLFFRYTGLFLQRFRAKYFCCWPDTHSMRPGTTGSWL